MYDVYLYIRICYVDFVKSTWKLMSNSVFLNLFLLAAPYLNVYLSAAPLNLT